MNSNSIDSLFFTLVIIPANEAPAKEGKKLNCEGKCLMSLYNELISSVYYINY